MLPAQDLKLFREWCGNLPEAPFRAPRGRGPRRPACVSGLLQKDAKPTPLPRRGSGLSWLYLCLRRAEAVLPLRFSPSFRSLFPRRAQCPTAASAVRRWFQCCPAVSPYCRGRVAGRACHPAVRFAATIGWIRRLAALARLSVGWFACCRRTLSPAGFPGCFQTDSPSNFLLGTKPARSAKTAQVRYRVRCPSSEWRLFLRVIPA